MAKRRAAAGITDKAGITDEDVVVELNVDHRPDPDAKGPVDFYIQTLDYGERVVDRWGNVIDAVPDDALIEREPYPGAKGGPRPPEPEGDPE